MELSLFVHTSWDCSRHSVMICGFRPPTGTFTAALDDVMEEIMSDLVQNLTRYKLCFNLIFYLHSEKYGRFYF